MELNEIHDIIEKFLDFSYEWMEDHGRDFSDVLQYNELKSVILDDFLTYKEANNE